MPDRNLIKRRAQRVAVVLALLLGFALFVYHWRSLAEPDAFGLWHDDTLLFASAQSLAAGEGYRLPSWPGGLPQTKYPPLYPAAVALTLSGDAEFPGSLEPALLTGAAFGLLFVAGCWMWLRGLGVTATRSAWLTAVCAAHPTVALLSASVLTDIPFAALMVWCAVAADRAVASRRSRTAWWWLAAACAACAILTRTLGLALPLGMAAVAWRARLGWRHWAAFSLPLAAFAAWTGWTAAAAPAPEDPTSGYGQTLVFYSSYLRFWTLSVPDWPSFFRMIPSNLLLYLREPALLTLQIPQLQSHALLNGLACVVSAGVLWGAARRLLTGRASTLHWAWIPYSGAVLLWNYPLMWRFLTPLLPLFLLALVEQVERLIGMCLRAQTGGSTGVRWLGRSYLAALGALGLWAAHGYLLEQPGRWRQVVEDRGSRMAAKREAYGWIERETPPDARFIAYEDVLLYLHTGRRAARPIALTTRLTYDSDNADWDAELDRLTDTAERLEADYWLTSADDYGLEPPVAGERLRSASDELFAGREPLFQSADGQIRIYQWPLRSRRPRRP